MQSPVELTRLATALGGLPVLGCLTGSPAEEAGMRYGDILLTLDGMPTSSWAEFVRARCRAGSRMVVRVFRQGVEFDLSLDLDTDTCTKSPDEVLEQLQQHELTAGEEADEGPQYT